MVEIARRDSNWRICVEPSFVLEFVRLSRHAAMISHPDATHFYPLLFLSEQWTNNSNGICSFFLFFSPTLLNHPRISIDKIDLHRERVQTRFLFFLLFKLYQIFHRYPTRRLLYKNLYKNLRQSK